MRIAHISDTHLGFSAYRRVDEGSGLNQREVDLYNAFQRCVDMMIDEKVELVLHSGDLFDSVRPSNRAISFAMEQFVRLTDSDAKVVVIAGNHSTPKMRETGSVFKIFEHLKGVRPVYQGRYEKVDVDDIAVHAVPHSERETMMDELDGIELDPDRKNVLMVHTGVAGVEVKGGAEHNEQIIPDSYLRKDFDYIALGHYHERKEVRPNAHYSGSTERLSFAEAGQRKGYLSIAPDLMKARVRDVKTRPMIDLPSIDAKGMAPSELMPEITGRLGSQNLDGAIVRLNVRNVTGALYRSLDFNRIRQEASKAMHFEPRFDMTAEEVSVQSTDLSFTDLDREFAAFLERCPIEGASREAVAAKGLEYIRRGLEGSE
ncbi:MAG: exonuclease SbcCD subunit D [Methanomassiliicoccales archaeon]|jgi:DNA repair exonuclease SbcCD nuclease subunit